MIVHDDKSIPGINCCGLMTLACAAFAGTGFGDQFDNLLMYPFDQINLDTCFFTGAPCVHDG